MKVGDYVRTKNGEIGKLVNVEVYFKLGQNDQDKFSCVLFDNSFVPCLVRNDFIIKKGQLIDLIEVGDYVNGQKINFIHKDIYIDEEWVADKGLENELTSQILLEEDIKSVVTKEQFEAMEYRIEE